MENNNNKGRVVNESIIDGYMSIEEAERLTLEKVRKIYEQNGKL